VERSFQGQSFPCSVSEKKILIVKFSTQQCMLQKKMFVLTVLFTKIIWASIAQSLQWQATGWVAWVQFLTVARHFSLLSVQTCSGAIQSPTEGIPGTVCLGVKQLGHEANHSHPSSAEIENGGAILPLTPNVFMACCLINEAQGLFYLYHLFTRIIIHWEFKKIFKWNSSLNGMFE
jgi:hypothetical protein